MSEREPNLAQPWAPHRKRIYLAVGGFTGLVFGGMTIGVGTGLIEPTFASDVIANLLFGVPVILVPFVLLWDAPGENRSRLDKAAELTLFYLPYTAGSQIGYELVFLIGHPLGWWGPTSTPASNGCGGSTGWPTPATSAGIRGPWAWRSSASSPGSSSSYVDPADQDRPSGGIAHPLPVGRICRVRGPDEQHRGVLPGRRWPQGSTTSARARSACGFKFIAENVPFIVLPPLVLYAIHLQIDYLTRRAGAQAVRALPESS